MLRFDLIVIVTVMMMMMHMYLHLGGRGYYYFCVGVFLFFSFGLRASVRRGLSVSKDILAKPFLPKKGSRFKKKRWSWCYFCG